MLWLHSLAGAWGLGSAVLSSLILFIFPRCKSPTITKLIIVRLFPVKICSTLQRSLGLSIRTHHCFHVSYCKSQDVWSGIFCKALKGKLVLMVKYSAIHPCPGLGRWPSQKLFFTFCIPASVMSRFPSRTKFNIELAKGRFAWLELDALCTSPLKHESFFVADTEFMCSLKLGTGL